MTGVRDNLFRAPRKDIKKGTRSMSFTAFKALLLVSLVMIKEMYAYVKLATHERHQNTVITFSANSYASFFAFSDASLGFSRYWERTCEISSWNWNYVVENS